MKDARGFNHCAFAALSNTQRHCGFHGDLMSAHALNGFGLFLKNKYSRLEN